MSKSMTLPTAAQMDAKLTIELTVAQATILALAVSTMVFPEMAQLTMRVLFNHTGKTAEAVSLINRMTPNGGGAYLLENPEVQAAK